MSVDASPPNLSFDEHGRAYRQVGTSRIYLHERRARDENVSLGGRGEHSYFSTPVPTRDEMSPKFRAMRNRPWSVPQPPPPPA